MSAANGLGDKPLRGALLGTGSISVHHMRAWRVIPGVQIVAMANRTRWRALAMGRTFGVAEAHIYADYRDLLDKEQIDFVDIATAPAIHHQQVIAAAQHGVHVICQKPFATSLAEAKEMIAACQTAGVRCIVHENWRWRRWYRELKALLDRGVIGTARYARFAIHDDSALPLADGSLPPLLSHQPYTMEMPRLILYEWGLHLVDVMAFLFGDVESVYARMSRVSSLVRGEDLIVITLVFRSGVIGVLDLSWGSHVPKERKTPRGSLDPFIVEGDQGTIELDPYHRAGDAMIITRQGSSEVHPTHGGLSRAEAYQESYVNTQSHIIHCLRRGEPAENEAAENLKTLAVVFAAYDAAERNQVVILPHNGSST